MDTGFCSNLENGVRRTFSLVSDTGSAMVVLSARALSSEKTKGSRAIRAQNVVDHLFRFNFPITQLTMTPKVVDRFLKRSIGED